MSCNPLPVEYSNWSRSCPEAVVVTQVIRGRPGSELNHCLSKPFLA